MIQEKEYTLPRFDEEGYDIGYELQCPCCESFYTHHYTVDVFQREKEDSDFGIHVTVKNTSTKSSHTQEDNPSPRRNGVTILFWCEECSSIFGLDIIQHKGKTYMGMFPTGREYRSE